MNILLDSFLLIWTVEDFQTEAQRRMKDGAACLHIDFGEILRQPFISLHFYSSHDLWPLSLVK